MKRIEYKSPNNGYTGVLYGERSYIIRDPSGKEVFHTGFRNINTYDELVKQVESFPEFRRRLLENWDRLRDDRLRDDDDGGDI